MLRQNESVQKIVGYLLQAMIQKPSQQNAFGRTSSCRSISSSTTCLKNHYDTLGISRAASQADIKSAYYKLSMTYHPDRNKGSDSAAQKFREITAAYEVLGNNRLRALYDKGFGSAGPGRNYNTTKEYYNDMAGTRNNARERFYRQQARRSERPESYGRTEFYDFDEWAKKHYAEALRKDQAAREAYRKEARDRQQNRDSNRDKDWNERRDKRRAKYNDKDDDNDKRPLYPDPFHLHFSKFFIIMGIGMILIASICENPYDVDNIPKKQDPPPPP